MPSRIGENKFVVSRKKDRSLTSPPYKRRAEIEQVSNSNYVPFVPFPPDYFAKKDNQQPEGTDSSAKATDGTSIDHPWPEFYSLLNNLSTAGYFNSISPHTSNEFPQEFYACLAFARDRADLLR